MSEKKQGNLFGVVLPNEGICRLQSADSDRLFLIEIPENGYRSTPCDPEFEAQMGLVEEGMARYRNTLRTLAT